MFQVISWRNKSVQNLPGPWFLNTHPDHFDIFPHWLRVRVLMDKILHHQGWWLSHYLLGFIHIFWPSQVVQRRISEPSTVYPSQKSPQYREKVGCYMVKMSLDLRIPRVFFSPPPSSIWGSQHHGVFFLSRLGFWCLEWNFVAGPERDFYVQCLGHPK